MKLLYGWPNRLSGQACQTLPSGFPFFHGPNLNGIAGSSGGRRSRVSSSHPKLISESVVIPEIFPLSEIDKPEQMI
jgi:hypothetical protein